MKIHHVTRIKNKNNNFLTFNELFILPVTLRCILSFASLNDTGKGLIGASLANFVDETKEIMYLLRPNHIDISTILRHLKSCSNGFSEKNMWVLLRMLDCMYVLDGWIGGCFFFSKKSKREINYELPRENQSNRAGKRNICVWVCLDFSKTSFIQCDDHLKC